MKDFRLKVCRLGGLAKVLLLTALVASCPKAGLAQTPQMQTYVVILGAHEYRAEIDWKTGDTLAVIQLNPCYCFTQKHFRNANHERDYWRMVNDVKKTLPIAKDARRLMTEAYVATVDMTEKEQKAYYQKLEKELFAQYKPRLKKLNYRQGKLLVRLVDRECDKQTYAIIREFLGMRRAFFWNMFGKMFGVSLKAEWEPDGKDRELEDVCIQVEQGMI